MGRVAGVGITPPGPLVAVAVGLHVHAARLRLRLEPLTALAIGVVPGEAPVSTGSAVAADRQQLLPHLLECRRSAQVAH